MDLCNPGLPTSYVPQRNRINSLAIGEVAEFLERIVEGIAGLRYVCSAKYRAKLHSRWKATPKIMIAGEMAGALIGLVLIAAITWGLASEVLR